MYLSLQLYGTVADFEMQLLSLKYKNHVKSIQQNSPMFPLYYLYDNPINSSTTCSAVHQEWSQGVGVGGEVHGREVHLYDGW